MIISSQVAREVASDIRNRGQKYYNQGRVKIRSGGPETVDARVRGTQQYSVGLTRTGQQLEAACDCPYFQDHFDICKHIWATVLAAEARGYLQGDSKPLLTIVPDEESINDPGEEAFDDYDNDFAPEPSRWQPYQVYTPPGPRKTGWKEQLTQLGQVMQPARTGGGKWSEGQQIVYIIDVAASLQRGNAVVETAIRERKRDGEWSKPRKHAIAANQLVTLPEPADRQILAQLNGASNPYSGYAGYTGYSYYGNTQFALPWPLYESLVPEICRTGRCYLRAHQEDKQLATLHWDEGAAWEFWLQVLPDEKGKNYLVTGQVRRGEECHDLSSPLLLLRGGLVFWDETVARLEDSEAFDLVSHFRKSGPLQVPIGQKNLLLTRLLALPRLPKLELPEELRFEEVAVAPKPYLKVKPAEQGPYYGRQWLRGTLSFQYGEETIPAEQIGRGVYLPEQRRLLLRDEAAERNAAERLRQLGFRPAYSYGQSANSLQLAPRNLPKVVSTLLAEGWEVEAEGKLYRRPGNFDIHVVSGIDWFELRGGVSYGDVSASLPALLKALQRGENTVRLDDGSHGILPETWLKKYGLLAGLGQAEDDHLRFSRGQVGLLDALLAEQPEVRWDAAFARARKELGRFEGIKAAKAPPGFKGELRVYQQEGLGWLHFLQRFGFGGCLADDMGLGKTIQVLALLESRRKLRSRSGPSLVVVPRSLIFNWKQEAQRFTPKLRVLDYTGTARPRDPREWAGHDVMLTTYGTLRRDIADLRDVPFDYCILDEAQAIKNANSESAKAARLVKADHRLALSGTPVQNHLGELWSLFEFLNPGLLGSARVFQAGNGRNGDAETNTLLARGLRPFILRRTKEQVAPELPPKSEQTLYCPLEPSQRKQYDELREHYRQALLSRIETDGVKKTTMHILEALLRLRQAACHPGLLDKKRIPEASAKLDMLLPQLTEVVAEGHKALVFSQFTSFLAIVKQRLDAAGMRYEYLDGRTRDRAARVERFQSDPDCKLFLISLKAGGLGLNLTAAEYVFLLDPWWNPYVEMQAIDRTHRIGQERAVFAYRLIAKDTVEERVLELQAQKRHLADALINADNSLIRNLTREDVEQLLA